MMNDELAHHSSLIIHHFMKYGFLIDHRKCIGCHACTVACKEENQVPLGVNRTWVKYIEKGEFPNTRRHFAVLRCNHCDNPPCVHICPTAALFKRSDGIVDFDNERCIGCKACMQACPYDALYVDPHTHTAAKCNFCAHRVEVNLKPACEIVCPEEAIISGDLDDANSKISQLISRQVVQARKPEQGTYPKLFYINADETAITPGAASTSNSYMWAEIPKEIEDRGSRIEDRRLNDGRGVADQSALSVTKNGSEGAQNKFLAKLMGEVPAVSTQHSAPSAQHAKIPLTAKTVYDVGHPKPWGGKISLYIWTKSISAGTFLLSTLLPYMNLAPRNALFRWGGPLIALIFLALTTIFLIVDLKRPDRFFYILTRPQWRSWLVLGGYSLTIYGIILSLWLIGSVFDVTSMQSVLLWPGVIFSILTTIYTGFLFGQAEGRDFWQSPLMPIHLLVQAIMAGSATLLLGSILFYGESATRALDLWMQGVLTKSLVGSLLVNIFIILVGELFMHHPNQDVQKVIHLITKGPFKFLFWVGAILIGNVLPLLLILSPSGALSLIGLLLALVGILGVLSTLSGSSMSPQKTLLKSWGYWVALIAIGLVPLTILLWGNTTMFLSIATFSAILFSLIGLLAFEHIRVMAGQSVPLS